MNWLAHVYLSEPDPAFRIGNLLPDLVPAGALASLPAEFQHGISRHRAIDAFTDSHPVVRQSVQRLDSQFRRYGGIIVDVLYDHFLAHNWSSYSPESLPEFTQGFYRSFDQFRERVPLTGFAVLENMRAGDWLCSYAEISGVSVALSRIGERLRRPIDLSASMSALQRNYDEFREDFQEFFPQLRSRFL